jgi:hypothetical protein
MHRSGPDQVNFRLAIGLSHASYHFHVTTDHGAQTTSVSRLLTAPTPLQQLEIDNPDTSVDVSSMFTRYMGVSPCR